MVSDKKSATITKIRHNSFVMKEKRKEAPDKMKINPHKISANIGAKEKAFSIRFMGN
jgi:hypothetical protein